MGLFSKAVEIRLRYGELIGGAYKDFEQEWQVVTEKMHANKGGFLYYNGQDHLLMHFGFGFDLTTFYRLAFPHELLHPILSNTAITSITGDDLLRFRSFFSSHEFESLHGIYIFPIQTPKFTLYAVLFDSSLNPEQGEFNPKEAFAILKEHNSLFIKYFSLIKVAELSADTTVNPALLKKIDKRIFYKPAVNMFTVKLDRIFPNFAKAFTDAQIMRLYCTIKNVILTSIGETNIGIFSSALVMHLAVFSNTELDAALYCRQLEQALTKIFGKEIAKHTDFVIEGYTTRKQDVYSFFSISGEC